MLLLLLFFLFFLFMTGVVGRGVMVVVGVGGGGETTASQSKLNYRCLIFNVQLTAKSHIRELMSTTKVQKQKCNKKQASKHNIILAYICTSGRPETRVRSK